MKGSKLAFLKKYPKPCLILSLVFISVFLASYSLLPTQTDLTPTDQVRQEHHSPPSVVIEPGSAVEDASYIIFKDDEGFVYAKSGDTGQIVKTSTNASEVIQYVIDQLMNGGKVFIKAGIYDISSTIVVTKSIELYGEGGADIPRGHGTILKAANGLNANIIEFNTSADYNQHIYLHDFGIDGNKAKQTAGNGIYAYKATRCKFERLEIRYVYEHGILIDGTASVDSYDNKIWACFIGSSGGDGLRLVGSEENDIVGLRTGMSGGRGIYLTSNINTVLGGVSVYDATGMQISGDRNKVIGWTCDTPDKECILINNAEQLRIMDVPMHRVSYSSNGTYSAIRSVNCQYVEIAHCSISTGGTSPTVPKYCLEMQSGSDYFHVFSNDFREYATASVLVVGTNNTFNYNHGFVTENSGTAASIADGYWQPHGLASTPTIVTLTPQSNVTVWVNDRNETHFQIGVSTGTVKVDWYAEV